MRHPLMKTTLFLLCTILAAACRAEATPFLAPVQPVNVPAQNMTRVECPFEIPEGQKVTCGTLKVPSDSSSGMIEEVDLLVTRYESESPAPEPDPILFLGYSPGVSRFFMSRGIFSSFIEKRDILFFYRPGSSGTEDETGAGSVVDCPALNDLTLNFLQQLQTTRDYMNTILEAQRDCKVLVDQAAISLAGTSASQTANDAMLVRQSLGYKQVNLYASGDSTLAVLMLMEQNPDAVRSAIMTSFYPPMAAVDLESSYSQALQRLFEDCGADEACNEAYPDLDRKFQEDIDQLNREPLVIEVKHPVKPDMIKVYIDGERFIYFMRDMLGSGNSLPRIPAVIEDIYTGKGYKLTADVQNSLMFSAFQQQGEMPLSACMERWAANSIADSPAAGLNPEVQAALKTDYDLQVQICSIWTQEEFTPAEVKAITSSLPVLVLHGAYDARYGPDQVEAWMKGFKNGQLVVLKGQGGRFGGGSCVSGIVSAFLENPDREVDRACVDTQPVEFVLPIQ